MVTQTCNGGETRLNVTRLGMTARLQLSINLNLVHHSFTTNLQQPHVSLVQRPPSICNVIEHHSNASRTVQTILCKKQHCLVVCCALSATQAHQSLGVGGWGKEGGAGGGGAGASHSVPLSQGSSAGCTVPLHL